MEFSIEDIERHSDNLNAISDAAVDDLRSYCGDLFAEVDWQNADDSARKQVRNQVIDHVNYIQETYGGASESVGSLFFDNAISNDGKFANALMFGSANKAQVENSVRYWARHLFDDEPNLDAFMDGVSSFVRRTVAHAADLSVADSAVYANKKHGIGVVYARVPQGPTCGFCIMLASRGFVYASRESAGQFKKYHDECNCRIVAGMPGTEVEGYDPEGMYDRYKACRDAITHGEVGDKNPIWRDWSRLSAEEQESYAEPTGGDAYNNYLVHRIVQEMSTRDRQWLYDGTIPEVHHSNDWTDAEKLSADILGSIGFKVDPISRSLEFKNRKPDFSLNGIDWEMKNPTGNGFLTVYNQFKKAVYGSSNTVNPQSDKLIITNVDNNMTFKELVDGVNRVLEENAFPEIKEIIALGRDGEFLRWNR